MIFKAEENTIIFEFHPPCSCDAAGALLHPPTKEERVHLVGAGHDCETADEDRAERPDAARRRWGARRCLPPRRGRPYPRSGFPGEVRGRREPPPVRPRFKLVEG